METTEKDILILDFLGVEKDSSGKLFYEGRFLGYFGEKINIS